MAKLFKNGAVRQLDYLMHDPHSPIPVKTKRENKRALIAAFDQARASKMNVYKVFHVHGETVRFEIKGVHLRKDRANPRHPYASVVHVDREKDAYRSSIQPSPKP